LSPRTTRQQKSRCKSDYRYVHPEDILKFHLPPPNFVLLYRLLPTLSTNALAMPLAEISRTRQINFFIRWCVSRLGATIAVSLAPSKIHRDRDPIYQATGPHDRQSQPPPPLPIIFCWMVENTSANPHNRSQLLQPSEILLLPFQLAKNR
jgi:hypothetical protein